MLTHGAKKYVKIAIDSISQTENIDYELVVIDNGSDSSTQRLLRKYHKKGNIQKLCLLNQNYLFAKGNNIAVSMANPKSKYVLLINSDIEIKDPLWLQKILDVHKTGATGLGYIEYEPYRPDGFCFLIDKSLYDRYKLDPNYEWWWSITLLEAQLLEADYTVTAIKEYENILHHFGGKSGDSWINAKGMDIDIQEVIGWFNNRNINVIEKV